ncbi:Gfo/Idh/MocA family oxidoreductase [Arsenicitalea aurantiaca]|uniref:Gfo/Idh/MocA family oxidoreductase n=1 Tax=Arsenicitalea aurantiaca TaxID=1783274 RepID=A0A433XAF3_9HYPH|nr:Gfo/Idh/MocA family oxidoreductase [Arsenicitalea aurantiaca]RUT31077.1 Gfo/Idh/MocA family oxidoreductase [Arsenicitalea aurantiaca]
MTSTLGVGLIGAHTWAEKAHLPGYAAHERVDLVAVCDIEEGRARAMAEKFGARKVYTDPEAMIADPDVQMVDVCTPTHTHLPLSLAAIAGGKHVLSEKPLHTEAAPAFDAARRADAGGVRTKLGFTFRYSPAIRQIKTWIEDGTLGEIFHIHGFEQNSQWLDPDFPLRQIAPDAVRDKLIPSSIIGYGSHLIDLMRWLGGEFGSVASSMKNFIPERVVRGEPGRQRVLVEDGAVALVEYANGTQGLLQTSYIAVGNYPGVEIRVYGSKGAAVARLIDEFGVAETLKLATADAVEFKPVEIGQDALPPGTTLNTPWPELYYRNLVRFFVDEILEDRPRECTFFDGAKSQEIVDAIIKAHYERRWVDLPGAGA